MIAFVLNYIFQFGNEMLITSFYASSLVTVSFLPKLGASSRWSFDPTSAWDCTETKIIGKRIPPYPSLPLR